MITTVIRICFGILIMNGRNARALLQVDNEILTISSTINDHIMIGQNSVVEIIDGASVFPLADGRTTASVNVGRSGASTVGGSILRLLGGHIQGASHYYGANAVTVYAKNKIIMVSGHLKGGESWLFESHYSGSIYDGNALEVYGDRAQATITGGRLESAEAAFASAILVTNDASVSIQGGYVDGPVRTRGTSSSRPTINISGGRFKDNSTWFLDGRANVNVNGCLEYDPGCGENSCPLSGFLADGAAIRVNVERKNTQAVVHLVSTCAPTSSPSPSTRPSTRPTLSPTSAPTLSPRPTASFSPTSTPSVNPSMKPSSSSSPSASPSLKPSSSPSSSPSVHPSIQPSRLPSLEPTKSQSPSVALSSVPSDTPSSVPSTPPSVNPSLGPSSDPSLAPSNEPSGMLSPPSDETETHAPSSSASPSASRSWSAAMLLGTFLWLLSGLALGYVGCVVEMGRAIRAFVKLCWGLVKVCLKLVLVTIKLTGRLVVLAIEAVVLLVALGLVLSMFYTRRILLHLIVLWDPRHSLAEASKCL